MNKARQRKQLPLPEESSPFPPKTHRDLPPIPTEDDTPPPPIPSRPGGHRPAPPPPGGQRAPSRNPLDSITSDEGDQEPGLYADAEEGAIYEDDDSFEQEEYDEFEVGPAEERELPPPPPPIQQEVYDDFDEGGFEEEPQNYDDFQEGQTYEVEPPLIQEDTYEAVPEPPPSARMPPSRAPPSVPVPPPAPPPGEEMYEAVPESLGQSAPTPPPARKQDAKPSRPAPQTPDREPKKAPPKAPGGAPGGLAIDLSSLQNRRDNLKKVSKPLERQSSDSHDTKDYGETSELKSPFEIFKAKEKATGGSFPVLKKTPSSESAGKPAITSPKPTATSPTANFESKSVARPPTNKITPRPKAEDQGSSPPPPPIDRPPLPGGHPPPPSRDRPPPAPPTGSLPPPPVKKDNYTKVNKPAGSNSPVINGGVQEEEEEEDPAKWPDSESDGEIYDDAISNIDPLRDYPWYFGEIERTAGNTCLKTKPGNGTYLVRKSKHGGDDQPYTLMVMYNTYIYNLKVRIDKKQRFALGEEKSDEITFKTVADLIIHHQNNPVILVHKSGQRYETMLHTIPNKP